MNEVMKVTLRHFGIFICVCDELGMTKAAVKLHMTQPSISQAVRELEEHYGVLLFERLGKRLFITEAGKRLLVYARHIINLNVQTEAAMRDFGKVYKLRVGASVTIGECVLLDLLQYIYKEKQEAQVFSEIHNTAELEAMLLRDELDMALVEGKVKSEYLLEQAFMEDELVFIASPVYAAKIQESFEGLMKMRFFLREEGSGTRNLFEQVMQKYEVQFHVAGVYNNSEGIKKVVEAGMGVSVISKRVVAKELKEGKLVTFKIPDIVFKRHFHIVYHKNKYISPELRYMIDLCNKIDMIL